MQFKLTPKPLATPTRSYESTGGSELLSNPSPNTQYYTKVLHHEKDQKNGVPTPSIKNLHITSTPPKIAIKSQITAELAMAEASEAHNESTDQSLADAQSGADDTPILNIDRMRLIDENFPFDESQLEAIAGMGLHQYCCLTGAAGTGKTTCTKAIVQSLLTEVKTIPTEMEEGEDGIKRGANYTPAIALCAFTGKATETIKKNFPESWHRNIMTIHYLLKFAPEWYEDIDEESGEMKNKMRFVPEHTAENKHHWDIILIDEASMLAVDLWHMLWAATPSTTRIIMIGDINQLPPVQGNSIYGFALTQWPSYELTHIHRQKGEHNPIVDNAWRVLKGETPKTEGMFQMLEFSDSCAKASNQLKSAMLAMQKRGSYDPITDICITPINGIAGQRGYELGQIPLNDYMALEFNPDSKRYMIDAGKEKRGFGIKDKVMVTKNDRQSGLTNGMTGIIVDIQPNGAYAGNLDYVGEVSWVRDNLKKLGNQDQLTVAALATIGAEQDLPPDIEDPSFAHSSHMVQVDFGKGKVMSFTTAGEVGSLQLAYVVTCHKSQGSEYPLVIIILHDIHKHMMYREWLYTAITRASEKVVILYNRRALLGALRKQKIRGSTLEQKKKKFLELASSKFRKPVLIPEARRLDCD